MGAPERAGAMRGEIGCWRVTCRALVAALLGQGGRKTGGWLADLRSIALAAPEFSKAMLCITAGGLLR